MNIKRSYFKLLTASAAVGLFLANCTVKNSKDESCEKGDKDVGCACPGGLTGYQLCDKDGVFGSCICPDDNSGAGTSNSNSSTAGKSNSSTGGVGNGEAGEPATNGGRTTTAGTDAGGVAAVNGGAGGAGGFPDFGDCTECLMALCQTEWDACFADEQCFTVESDGTGEYEAISDCIEKARVAGLVKRDAVRSCGITFGASSDPDDTFPAWAPQDMAATTTNLINCMATSSSQQPNAQWANDPNNFPAAGPTPWPADSCAKLACTSEK